MDYKEQEIELYNELRFVLDESMKKYDNLMVTKVIGILSLLKREVEDQLIETINQEEENDEEFPWNGADN